jgi:glucose/arabinose dehydrogenase
MKLKSIEHLSLIVLASWLLPITTIAATIWTGPLVTFTQASPYPGSGDRDQLTAKVALTRATPGGSDSGNGGIFNAVTETSFTKDFSPADTEWAVGSLADYATLRYSDWTTAAGGNPVNNYPGEQLVVHLISDDIYLSLQFISLPSGPGFSYIRSTPPAADVPPTVAITSPTNGAAFTAPANVAITATASDSDGSVTNVAFLDGTTLLGQTNNTPYAITASLAAGPHALTAVATDNGGLSTTSAVVNISISAANVPPSVTITNPVDNAKFGNTDTIAVKTSASDSDGSVTNVQLFNGAVLLRSFSAAPYNFSGTAISGNFALGTNTLTAVATDNLGASTTSAPVHVIIARYLPPITNGTINIFLQPVATNLAAPDYAISPPGDTNRLFVVEQNGLLWIIQNGVLLPTPTLNITNRVQPPLVASNPNDERGFLGLAFHPGFNNPASPGYRTLYTYNSETNPVATAPTYVCPNGAVNNYKNVLNEWKISSTNANIVDPGSRREVISFGKNASNHNGGTCTFGPDGYLYLALGDGGDANDVGASHIVPGGNAQNLSTPLGKFLRFDPLNPALNPTSPDPVSTNGQYRIPTSNPFQGAGQVPEIYCYGMRNPYRFAFDTVTGDLIEGDVGQNDVEEINRIVKGGNFGWAMKEGTFLFNMTNGPAGPAGTIGTPPGNNSPGLPAGLIDPISGTLGTLEYDHNEGISITGGFVYRGTAIPELYGKYIFGDLALQATPVRANGRIFYADLVTGLIKAFPLAQFGGSAILPNGLTVHGFGQDAAGEIYALVTNTSANGNGGLVYKLVPMRLAFQVLGNQLNITWPVAGGRLQVQTNNLNAGIGTNWVTVAGSTATNQVVVPLNPSNGSVFYRLAVP